MMTFHNVKYFARGLNFVMTKPAESRPAADAISAKLPVNIDDADADWRYKDSMSFGEKIQNGMKLTMTVMG